MGATQSTKKVVQEKVTEVEEKVVKPKTTEKIVKKVKKVKKVPVVKETVVEEPVVEQTPVVDEPVVEEPPVVEDAEDDFIEDNAEEISHLKKKPEQKQSLLKALRELKSDSFRLMKIRNKAPTSGNSKSGFNMPVNVTSEMKNFISTNQDTDAEITRS